MLYHAEQFPDSATKVQQGRSLLEFMAQSVGDDPYGATLRAELDTTRRKADAYVFHDYLEPDNHAVYFHQFAREAREQGLVYLAEASFPDMMVSNFSPAVADTLRRIGRDLIRLEQYMDFVRNRSFRQSLLVHEGAAINRRVGWQALRNLQVHGLAEPATVFIDLDSDAPAAFRTDKGSVFTPSHAMVKAAMLLLAEQRPRAIPFDELAVRARERVQERSGTPVDTATAAQDAEILGTTLLQCYGAGVVDLHTASPAMVVQPSARPRASALARVQARRGRAIVNLWHEPVALDPQDRALIPLLDGTRDRAALIAAMAEGSDGAPDAALDVSLSTLAKAALLDG